MGLSGVISEVLAEDEGLAGLLVGGIYAYDQIGRNGLSRVTTPEAYDASGFLKPCAVVKVGEAKTASGLRDAQSGLWQRIEVYLYDDGDSGYETIREAQEAAVAALDRRWIDGAGYVRRVGGGDELRDAKLNNASLVRIDFEVTS